MDNKIIEMIERNDIFTMNKGICIAYKGIIKLCNTCTTDIIGLNLHSATSKKEFMQELAQTNMYKGWALVDIEHHQKVLRLKAEANRRVCVSILKKAIFKAPFTLNDFEKACFAKIQPFLESILKKSEGVVGVCKLFADFENGIIIQPDVLVLVNGKLHAYTFYLADTFQMDSEDRFAYPFEHVPKTQYTCITLKSHIERYIIEKEYGVIVEKQHIVWFSDKQAVYFEPDNTVCYSTEFMHQFFSNAFIQKDIMEMLRNNK
jgi:hypothetical protein